MVDSSPAELEFLSEIFSIIKSLFGNQKPDYPKFIKKTYSKLKEKQNVDLNFDSKNQMSRKFDTENLSE